MTITETQNLNSELADLSLDKCLLKIDEMYGKKAVFTTSFGLEDQAITHAIFTQNLSIRVVTLDTGRLFRETYELHRNTLLRYNKQIETYFPQASDLEPFLLKNGPDSFYSSIEQRKECCHIRKVIPLERALVGAKIWITGIRSEQSGNRSDMPKVELDSAKNIHKVHPILNWTWENTWDYIRSNNIPYNTLHDKGYPSIGCAPCTRAIEPGEDFRAGRWWWENEDTKECGLHWVDGKLTPKKAK
ncbi:MAG: phosphoadenylyl-sulfate reductase [Leptospira sp.]|nr:phosphoadenylyl-sulfate reductase [Leptospira sp.]